MHSNVTSRPSTLPRVSIVVPIFNEEETVDELHAEILGAMSGEDWPYEVIFVDDGSTDGTFQKLKAIHAKDGHVSVMRFRRNFGQAAALAAGFEHARGEVIIPLDADFQNDPADIPRMVKKLDEGYDVVAGWDEAVAGVLASGGRVFVHRIYAGEDEITRPWNEFKARGVEPKRIVEHFKRYRYEVAFVSQGHTYWRILGKPAPAEGR